MKLPRRKTEEAEILLQSFAEDLKKDGFDIKIFDRKQIKKHLGRGLYTKWREVLSVLHYKKLIMIFEERETEISWPSYDYPDRLAVNMARTPDKEALLGAEKELLGLLELEREIS